MPQPEPSSEVTAETQELYEQFLRRLDEGEELPFESFLEDNLDHAAQLQVLHDRWEKLGGLVDALGGDDQPASEAATLRIVSGPVPVGDPASAEALERLITRLGERTETANRYGERAEIGSGGMGVVYRAWDSDLRRQLAMKVMRPPESKKPIDPTTTARQLGRFLEEAQITGQLDHPGVVPVHELGVDEKGRIYFTMRLVRGRSLRTIFDLVQDKREGWTVARCLGVLLKVCEALAYAHSKNVLHRDIKPSNIMVGRFGEVYVMDWGLAKVLVRGGSADGEQEEEETPSAGDTLSEVQTERADSGRGSTSPLMTLDGSVVGTPAYMPPEQARGEIDKLGPPSDVYAVGALIYQLLSGRMPYVPDGKRVPARDVLKAVREGPPRPLHQLNPRVDPELAAICDKAMAREPRDRYENMSEMADELRAFLEGRVVKAHGSGALVELRKWVVRNKTVAVLLLMFGIAVAGWGLNEAASARDLRISADALRAASQREKERGAELQRTNDQLQLAQAATDLALQGAKDEALRAQRNGYEASLAAAQAALRDDSRAELLQHLEDTPLDLRGWEWEHLAARSNASLTRLTELNAPPVAATFTPDGERVATVSRRGDLELLDTASGRLLARLDVSGFVPTDLVFTPDGERVAISGRDGAVHLYDATSGAPGGVLRPDVGGQDPITKLALTGEDGLLLAGTRGGNLLAWRLGTSRAVNLPRIHNFAITDLAVSTDGGLLISGSAEPSVSIVDIGTGDVLQLIFGFRDAVSAVAYSPAASRIAIADASGALQVRGVGSETPEFEVRTEPAVVEHLSFSRDGSVLLAATNVGNLRVYDAWSGELNHVMMGHAGAITSLDVDPVGARVITGGEDNTLRTWDLTWGAAVTRLVGHTDDVRSLAVAQDGGVVSASWDGRVRLWDPESLSSRAATDLPGGGAATIAISKDGRHVAAGVTDVIARESYPILLLPGGIHSDEDIALKLIGHEMKINAVAFDPSGKLLASASDDRSLRLWSVDRGALVRTFEGHASWVRDVAFHPNRPWVASASFDETVRLWGSEDGNELAMLEDHTRGVNAVAFSPDGRYLASAGEDRVIHLYDTRNGPELVATMSGHRSAVIDIAFHPDGQRLVSASAEGYLRVWSLPEGKSLLTLRAGANLSDVAFAPNGERLFAAVGNEILSFETGRAQSGFEARHGRDDVLKRAQELFTNLLDALEDPRRVGRELDELSGTPEPVRAEAVRLLRNFSTDPTRLIEGARGLLPERTGDPSTAFEARRLARAANAITPGRAQILHVLGRAEFRCGNVNAALPHLNRAQLLNLSVREYAPELDTLMLCLVHASLGQTALAEGQLEDALATIEATGQPPTTAANRLLNEARSQLDQR